MLASLTSATYSADSLGLTTAQRDVVLTVYMDGLRYSFIFYTACTGLGFVLSLGIGNTPLDKEKKAKVVDEESQEPDAAGEDITVSGSIEGPNGKGNCVSTTEKNSAA
jgi:hypothetical protein